MPGKEPLLEERVRLLTGEHKDAWYYVKERWDKDDDEERSPTSREDVARKFNSTFSKARALTDYLYNESLLKEIKPGVFAPYYARDVEILRFTQPLMDSSQLEIFGGKPAGEKQEIMTYEEARDRVYSIFGRNPGEMLTDTKIIDLLSKEIAKEQNAAQEKVKDDVGNLVVKVLQREKNGSHQIVDWSPWNSGSLKYHQTIENFRAIKGAGRLPERKGRKF